MLTDYANIKHHIILETKSIVKWKVIIKQGRQCTYNVIMRHVRAAIVEV